MSTTSNTETWKFGLAFWGYASKELFPYMQRDAAQQQQPQDNYLKFLEWVQVNQKRLILWGTVALLAVAAVFFWMYFQGQKELRASLALSNVRVPLSPGAPAPAGTADAYLKVAKEHGGTKAAQRALLLGAATLFTDGKYTDAQKTFEEFLKEYPESQWVPQGHYGIAACLDAQGKNPEATAKFEEIRKRYANEPIMDEVKLALGRLYENQNKFAEAHKLYTELVGANQFGGISAEAGVRREDLEAKHPELAKKEPPIMSPPVMPQPAITGLTNRPGQTNRVIVLSNMPPRTVTNAPARGTNVPLLLQPQPAPNAAQPPASPPPTAPPGTNKQ